MQGLSGIAHVWELFQVLAPHATITGVTVFPRLNLSSPLFLKGFWISLILQRLVLKPGLFSGYFGKCNCFEVVAERHRFN